MTRLLLIRHGETDWNVEGRWQGQIDVPLNANGRRQAAQTAKALADTPIAAIYSSDLKRAYETAQALAQVKGLPVIKEPRLREIHQGDWQGLLVSEIETRYAERFHQRRRDPLSVAPPGGETVQQVRARAWHAIEDIVSRHPTETIAIVAHGFILALVRVSFEKKPYDDLWKMIPGSGECIAIDIDPKFPGTILA
jgi:broad specificity phosphatase PhoE